MGIYRPASPQPVVKAARHGKTAYSSRDRRMLDLAAAPTPQNMLAYDMGAITPVPGPSNTLRDPLYAGEEYWLWLNSTSGGTWEVACGDIIGTLAFTAAEQWAFLKAITVAGVLEWVLVNYAGCTFTGDGPGGGGIPVPP